LQENKIPIFEREGWLCQPSLSKIGILLIRRSLITMNDWHWKSIPRYLSKILNFACASRTQN